jgi:hypothetical protein
MPYKNKADHKACVMRMAARNRVRRAKDPAFDAIIRERHKSEYEQRKAMWQANPDEHERYKEQRRQYQKKRRLIPKYRAKNALQAKLWREKHPERVAELARQSSARSRATRKDYRILYNIRTRIYLALHGKNKSKRTEELLGCSIQMFMAYLESLLKPGMSWDNYGVHGWHLDHIKPCAMFNLSDPSEQRKCFHYSNMQPMWAKENLIKHDHYDGPAEVQLPLLLVS